MPVVLFDTRRGKKVEFAPRDFDTVRIYSCGPTVHTEKHLGELRPYVVLDVLKRRLAALHGSVQHVVNITDVGHLTDDADAGEDRLERAARKSGKTVAETAERHTRLFQRDLERLNVPAPTTWAKASEHVREQIAMIVELERKGFTYCTDDGIYFDARKDAARGRFRHATGTGKPPLRVVAEDGKRGPSDFALWKFSVAGSRQASWDSPWGVGVPGWHVECAAMAAAHLGAPIDLHTGAVDHIHVHHENELALSESALDVRPWVGHWLHVEAVTVPRSGLTAPSPGDAYVQMSDARGNAVTLDQVVLSGIDPRAVRLLLLGTHYRRRVRLTWGALAASARAYDRLVSEARALPDESPPSNSKLTALLWREFDAALDDDLNTPRALSILWRGLTLPSVTPRDKLELLREMDRSLGLGLTETGRPHGSVPRAPTFTPEVMQLVEERSTARAARDFARADALRLELLRRGFVVQDHGNGTRVRAS